MSRTEEGLMGGCIISPIFIWLYFAVCWVVNLVKFISCDFDAPYKDEIIHAIGVFTFVGSGITAWF